jgi:replicative DNA helicase
MAKAPFDPAIYVHSPADMGVMYVEHYQFLLDNPGIQWGVECLDKIILPARPGDLIIICGRPGSGKTSLLARQAKRAAHMIAEREKQLEECVMYVSWEEHAEQLEVYFAADETYTTSDYHWCRVPIEEVKRKAYKRARFPLWMIGYSRRHILKQSQTLTLNLVMEALESMVYTFRDAPRPILLCFDYAQLIPPERKRQSYRLELKDVVQAVKHLGLRIGCPVILAAQAGRQVDGYRPLQVPGMADAQEGSSLEQHCNLFLGVSRPWKWAEHYKPIRVGNHMINVTPDLFLLKMNKQRGEDGDRIFPLQFSMSELELAKLELNQEEPAGWDREAEWT